MDGLAIAGEVPIASPPAAEVVSAGAWAVLGLDSGVGFLGEVPGRNTADVVSFEPLGDSCLPGEDLLPTAWLLARSVECAPFDDRGSLAASGSRLSLVELACVTAMADVAALDVAALGVAALDVAATEELANDDDSATTAAEPVATSAVAHRASSGLSGVCHP